jgi:hypothetical protein
MKPFRSLAAFCSALLLAAALGCSPDTAPTAAPPAPDLSLIGDLTNTIGDVTGTVTDLAAQVLPIKGLLACNVTQTYSTTQSVGPLGGTIRVGPHSLVIPANALSARTTITATAPAGKIVEVEFYPHGLKFQKQTTLTMSYRDCGLLKDVLPQIVYADDKNNIIEQLLSLVNILNRTVSAKTDHFSSYILAER